MFGIFGVRLSLLLAPCCAVIGLTLLTPAHAGSLAGTYQGFLAFDFKGKEVREQLMISFHEGGAMIMGAEEGHDEPVDPKTGLATKNDIESANLGAWRQVGNDVLEFGSQQYRAGSGFCKPVNKHGKERLPTCSFILTARLKVNAEVRGEKCDLGGIKGGFSIQSIDGVKTETNPFGLNLKLDYCLRRMTVNKFFKLAPME
jgi:hypothetical protein